MVLDSSNDIDADYGLDLQIYFDLNSAASSPKPNPGALNIPRQLPQQYHHSQNQFNPMSYLHPSPRPMRRPGVGKRPREDEETDISRYDDGSYGGSPTQVKNEYNPAMQFGNGGFGNGAVGFGSQTSGSLQGFDFSQPFMDSPFPTAAAEPPQPAVQILPQNGSGTAFSYQLMVDFPKHTKPSGPASFVDPQVKSRVETQISVRFILSPASEGVSKLRLPRHAISKIKYIEDGHPANSPDTLELQATLVCASAMGVPDQLERALCEARGAPVPERITKLQHNKVEAQKKRIADAASNRSREDGDMSGSSSGSREGTVAMKDKEIDYDNPVFGAPVQICEQCMNRERKRASRKKNKKPEEEEKWAQDERKRIIVFNTNQVRPFEQYPDAQRAIAAETQMRICCYCRHHGEKDGFQ